MTQEKFDTKELTEAAQKQLKLINKYINRYDEMPIVLELLIEGKSLATANQAYHIYQSKIKKLCDEEEAQGAQEEAKNDHEEVKLTASAEAASDSN